MQIAWVLAVVLIAGPQSARAVASVSPEGCHLEQATSREFIVPGYNYHPITLDIDQCRLACGQLSLAYAGLQAGDVCACADAYTVGNVGSACSDDTCPGDPSDECGSLNNNHVFISAPVVLDLAITDPGIVAAYEPIPLSVTNSFGTIASYELWDLTGADVSQTYSASPLTYALRRAGTRELRVQTTDSEGGLQDTSLLIAVQTKVTGVEIDCPAYVEVNTVFECSLSMRSGSAVTSSADLGEGDPALPLVPAETIAYVRGEISGASLVPPTVSGAYALVNQLVEYEATLMGWELHVHTPGTLTLEIKRPTCMSVGTRFCFRSYTCISDAEDCASQVNRWSKRCTSGQIYSMTARACVSTTDGSIIHNYFTDSWANMPIQDFEVVHSHSVDTGVETGVYFSADTSGVHVQPGDMLAFTEATGRLYYEAVPASCYEIDTATNACFNNRHMLRAHLVKPSSVRFSHNYTVVNDYTVSVEVDNDVTDIAQTSSTIVDVQERIHDVEFVAPEFAATDSVVDFEVLSHSGTEVTYNWTYSDGTTDSFYEQLTTTHVFTEPGVYPVQLLIYNGISQANYTWSIIIQDLIANFTIVANTIHDESATVFGENTMLNFSLSQGTNVTFEVDMGDGTTYELSHLSLPDPPELFSYAGLTASLAHLHGDLLNYTVNATASNLVNNATFTLYVPVQVPISGLSIVLPAAIPYGEYVGIYVTMDTGSNITFSTTLDGIMTSNYTLNEGEGNGGHGYIVITPEQLNAIGDYDLTITYDNLVTTAGVDHSTVYVEYRVEDVWVLIDRPFVPVGEAVTFNTSMRWGGRFTLNIQWDDGTPMWNDDILHQLSGRDVTHISGSDADPYWLIAHSFSAPGNYSVTHIFDNVFGTTTYVNHILVQYPVADLVLTSSNPVLVQPGPIAGDLMLTLTHTGTNMATDPSLYFDYGDYANFSAPLSMSAQAPYESTHSYIQYDTYNLTLNVSNYVNFMWFEISVNVDEMIGGMQVDAIPYHVITHTEANVSVTMTSGSRMTLLWDFQDGATDEQFIDRFTQPMYSVHQYTTPGIHQVSVQATNVHSSVTTNVRNIVVVQNHLENVLLTCNQPLSILEESGDFTEYKECYLHVAEGTDQATDVYVQIIWDDGNENPRYLITTEDRDVTMDTSTHYHILTVTHTTGYQSGSNYTVVANLDNLVSNMSLSFDHTLYEEITGLNASVVWMHPETGEGAGYGAHQTIFRQREPVHFRSGFQRGSHVTYVWDYGDGQTERIRENPNAVHSYDAPGVYTITMRAQNPLNSATVTRTILLQTEASEAMSFYTDSPYPMNRTHTFNVSVANSSLGDIPTDACYRLNFGGAENDTVHISFFGNLTQCEISFPDYQLADYSDPNDAELININDLRITREEITTQYFQDQLDATGWANISMSTNYMTIGQWFASLTAVNIVSRLTTNFRMVTTEGFCFPPTVDLESVNLCTPGYDCDEETGLRTIMRGDESVWQSSTRVRCETSNRALFTWTAAHVDPDTGEETEIDIDVQGNVIEGISLRQVILNPRTFPYGLNRIYLNMSMADEIGLWATSHTDVIVTPTPLRGEMSGGSSVARQWNTNITIDARTQVADPDLEPGDYTGMTWTWYCKRRCETWPTFSEDYSTITDPSYTSECVYTSEVQHDEGCFRDDGVEGPIESIGEGEDGLRVTDTYLILERDVVDIMVIVRKGDRYLRLRQRITVVQGEPPDIRIVCVTNCENQVNPTARFSMLSKINGWRRGMSFYYWWKLFKIPEEQVNEEYDPVYKLADQVWSGYSSTGLLSDNMALNAGLFAGPSFPKDGFVYRLQVEAVRHGSSPDNKGWGTKDFVINDSPMPGNCSVVPPRGQALETLFNVNCSDPFEDAETPLSYELGYRQSATSQITWFYSGTTVTMPNDLNLPNGPESSNYTIEVVIKCKDRIGSETLVFLDVQVLEATPEARQELLANISSNPEAFAASLEQGSTEDAAVQIMTVSNVMNEDAGPSEEEAAANAALESQLSDDSISEEERLALEAELEEQRRRQEQERLLAQQEQRRTILEAMTALVPTSTTAVRQVMYASISMTAQPEQVSADSIDLSLSIMQSSADAILAEAGRDSVMADELEAAVSPMIDFVSNIRSSITVSTAADSSSSDSAVSTTPGPDDAAANARAQTQVDTLFDVLNQTGEVLLTRKVPGESNTVIPDDPASSTVLICGMQLTRDFDNSQFSGGQGEMVGVRAETLVGPANESTYFISSTSTYLSTNPYSFMRGSEYNVQSSLMSLDLRNDTGDPIVAEDLSELFELVLQENDPTEPEEIVGNTTDVGEEMTVHGIHNFTTGSALFLRINVHIPENNGTDQTTMTPDTSTDSDMTTSDLADEELREADPNDDYVWRVFVKVDAPPTEEDSDFNFTLPLSEEERMAMILDYQIARSEVVPTVPAAEEEGLVDEADGGVSSTESATDAAASTETMTTSATDIPAQPQYEYTLPDRWTVFVSNLQLDSLNPTTGIYFGIKHERANSTNNATDALPTTPPPTTGFEPASYSAKAFYKQCLWYVPENASWSSSGCEVIPLSDVYKTYCGCNHLTSFAGGMVVPANSVNLQDSAFLNLGSNPIVFATMVSIMALYLVMVVWARKKDKQDEAKAGTTALLDNDPRDKYLYEIVVFTGERTGAGTSAKVRFIMSGEEDETQPRLMWDDKRPVLQRTGVDSFVMAVPNPLGQLTHMRIWHDNGGKSPSWYFSRMQVTDMQTDDQYFFIHDRWLAVEEDDGMIDRIIPIAGKDELTSFHHLFWTNTQKNLADGHIWFSIFKRPARSRFTRVQRLTCCLALLFTSMMANIMFYQNENTSKQQPQMYRLGPINFSMQMVYVGFISAMIVFPASIGIVALFRYSAERPQFKSAWNSSDSKKKKKSNDKGAYDTDMQSGLDSELVRQREYLDTGDEDKRLLRGTPSPPPGYYERGVSFISIKGFNDSKVAEAKPPAKKKKKSFQLPWFFIYVGYAAALCVTGVSFWMTVEVAGVFGPEKSKEWLFSFCLSVVESVFISQPLKVLLLAIFFALVWKKPEVEKDDRPAHLRPDEKWLHVHLEERDLHDQETQAMLRQYKQGPQTLDAEYLKAAREERFKEIQMVSILRDLLFYLLFLYLLMMVGYGNRDPWSVYVNQNMRHMFMDGSAYPDEYGSYKMSAVHSKGDFWNWLNHSVFPAVFYENFYDGQTHEFLDGWTSDLNSYLIGEMRLRQVRIHSKKCTDRIRNIMAIENCEQDYSMGKEDDDSYMMGWGKPNASIGEEPDRAWKYRTWQELDGYPTWGNMATYSGGGYVANMGRTQAEATETMHELIEHMWLDGQTRGVFIEFLLYNPNMNLWSVSQMLIEFTDSGAGYSFFRFHVMRLNRYFGTFMFVVLAAELLTLCFVIFFIQREIKAIIRLRKTYFESFWNCVEVLILCLCVVCLVMFFYRLIIGQSMEEEIKKKPMKYHNFQHVVIWDEAYAYILGLILFLSTIKFMKLLRFNKKMSQLSSTLRYAAHGILSFLLIFAILFGAFVQMAFLMFYGVLLDFSTFVRTAETMFSLMLNKFNFDKMEEADRFWGPLIVFAFTLFVSFVLINFFLTIVIDAYARVRDDLSKQSNDYEIVNFMVERFKRIAGIDQSKNRRAPPPRRGLEFEPDDYLEGADPNAAEAEVLRERIDTMFDKLMMAIHFRQDDKDMQHELGELHKRRKIVMS